MLMSGMNEARRPLLRSLVLALIAGALFLRVLIPAGWMPVSDGRGWVITICTGTGPMQMAMPMDMAKAMNGSHQKPDKPEPAGADHICPYAGCAAALQTPLFPRLILPQLIPAIGLSKFGVLIAVGRGLAAPPPPATGPPMIS